MRRFISTLAVVAALFAGCTLMAKLLQCPKCGYEYEEGVATCTHCGRELPAPKIDAVPAPTSRAAVTAEVIDQEVSTVTRAARNEHPAIVVLRARNTLALLKVAPEGAAARAAGLIEAMTAAEKLIRDAEQACFACRGTGQRVYGMVDMKGDVRYQQAAPGTVGCPVCKGAGKLPARASLNVIVSAMATARKTYERQQEARGWEDVGGVWLPKGAGEGLDLHQKAALKTAMAGVCTTCYGFGMLGCATCDGMGKLKCENDTCVQGREQCPTCNGKKKVTETTGNRSVDHTCPTCAGKGVALCATCEGQAFLACTKCEATGQAACKQCKGTGENPACTRCDGSGITPCRSCKGTGDYRGAPCPHCKGEKESTCSYCNGAGHRVR